MESRDRPLLVLPRISSLTLMFSPQASSIYADSNTTFPPWVLWGSTRGRAVKCSEKCLVYGVCSDSCSYFSRRGIPYSACRELRFTPLLLTFLLSLDVLFLWGRLSAVAYLVVYSLTALTPLPQHGSKALRRPALPLGVGPNSWLDRHFFPPLPTHP